MILMITEDIIFLFVILILFISGVCVLLYLKWSKKDKFKPIQVINVSVWDESNMIVKLLGTDRVVAMTISEKNPALVSLFKQELALARNAIISEINGTESHGDGARWKQDGRCFLLQENAPLAAGQTPMMAVVFVQTVQMLSSNLLEDYVASYQNKQGYVEVITDMKIVFRTQDCGEQCRTDLLDHARMAYSTATVHEKLSIDGRPQARVYRVSGNSDGYFVGEMSFDVTHIPENELDVYYAPPEVRAQGLTYLPPMSVEFSQIIAQIQQGKNFVISGKFRSGKSTLVQNIVDVITKKFGGYVVMLNQEVLTVNQPVIQQLLTSWTEARKKEAGGDVIVVYIVDEASTLFTGRHVSTTKANILDMMSGFSSSESGVTKSVILSMSATEDEIPVEVLGPGRCHHFITLQPLPEVQVRRVLRIFENKGRKANALAVEKMLEETAFSPKGFAVIGEVISCTTSQEEDPLEQYRVGHTEMA